MLASLISTACAAAALAAPPVAAQSGPAMPSLPALMKRAAGYDDPNELGGSMLTVVNNTYPPGLGEPLNVIISGDSDPIALVDSLDNGGFQNYMLSAYLSNECMGAKMGSSHLADLDGKENVTEKATLRHNFGDPYLGSCRETFEGGNHLRYWRQNHTGAYFLAVSVEMSMEKQHDIIPNGYDIGRDLLVGNVTNQTWAIDSRSVSNTTEFTGTSEWNNYTYETHVKYVSGMLQNSSDNINHYITVEADGYPAIDGLVAVLTVKVLEKADNYSCVALGASCQTSSVSASVPSATAEVSTSSLEQASAQTSSPSNAANDSGGCARHSLSLALLAAVVLGAAITIL